MQGPTEHHGFFYTFWDRGTLETGQRQSGNDSLLRARRLVAEANADQRGHRSYSFNDLRRLTFIRRGRELGFSTGDIRDLLALVDGGAYTCSEVRSVTLEHAKSIRRKISDLRRMREILLGVSALCEGGSVPECPIIDALFELKKDSSG